MARSRSATPASRTHSIIAIVESERTRPGSAHLREPTRTELRNRTGVYFARRPRTALPVRCAAGRCPADALASATMLTVTESARLAHYARDLPDCLASISTDAVWDATHAIAERLCDCLPHIAEDFRIDGIAAVHHSARIDPTAIVTGPVIVCGEAVVGPHAHLRDGVFIGRNAHVGASVEVKASFVRGRSAGTSQLRRKQRRGVRDEHRGWSRDRESLQ